MLLISADANEALLKENAAGSLQEGLVVARHSPVSPGTCNPEETGLPGLPVS